MHRPLASPDWPADLQIGGGRSRRFGLPALLLLSLLTHGMALRVNFHFRPIFPVDRGSPAISVILRASPLAPVKNIDNAPPETASVPTKSAWSEKPGQPSTRLSSAPSAAAQATIAPALQPAFDGGDLLERSKAEINASSRRKMLDPMFSAASQTSGTSPLERATAGRQQTAEQFEGKLVRVTSAQGRRYCLQGLPDVATRDIPRAVLAIPMLCN